MSSNERFGGKRILVTQANQLMGPAIADRFRDEGAHLICDTRDYTTDPFVPARAVDEAGRIDVLVVNLRPSKTGANAVEATKEQAWQLMFDQIVHPTMRFITAVLPQMIERGEGKIVVVSSAIPLRPINGLSV